MTIKIILRTVVYDIEVVDAKGRRLYGWTTTYTENKDVTTEVAETMRGQHRK